ncbi:kinase-like domain-containing protein [Aspergillus venezuelensis]
MSNGLFINDIVDDLSGKSRVESPESYFPVIHKLGFGETSTVWLCVSKEGGYFAVKVHAATISNRELQVTERLVEAAKADAAVAEYCSLPVDQFQINGPNGTHQAFVFPAAGPRVECIDLKTQNPAVLLRGLVRQVVEAVAAVHRQGICHGYTRPHNVLLGPDLPIGMAVAKALEHLGKPAKISVLHREGISPGPKAPEYIVTPIEFVDRTGSHETDYTKLVSPKLKLVDFGDSFATSEPPSKEPGEWDTWSLIYVAPGLHVENRYAAAAKSDTWSLAISIFEIRIGELFLSREARSKDEFLEILIDLLGHLPEPWWSTAWGEHRRTVYKDEPDANGNAVYLESSSNRAS